MDGPWVWNRRRDHAVAARAGAKAIVTDSGLPRIGAGSGRWASTQASRNWNEPGSSRVGGSTPPVTTASRSVRLVRMSIRRCW